MYPANDQNVISIRYTDTYGELATRNPPPERDSGLSLWTLGKEVKSASLFRHGGERVQSGTSVATAVATGIATKILSAAFDAIHNAQPPGSLEHLYNLSIKSGMVAMLKRMSVYQGDSCFYLDPMEHMARDHDDWVALMSEAVKFL